MVALAVTGSGTWQALTFTAFIPRFRDFADFETGKLSAVS